MNNKCHTLKEFSFTGDVPHIVVMFLVLLRYARLLFNKYLRLIDVITAHLMLTNTVIIAK